MSVPLIVGIGVAGLLGGLATYSNISGKIAERRVPADGSFVDVEGARLHYVDVGSGPTIVLVHGLTGQLRNFTHSLVARLAGKYRVIAVDRPGSGHSRWKRPSERGLRGQAGVLRDFLAALGVERPLIVGHSLGGAIALTLAEECPGKLAGLALICPLTQPMQDAPKIFKALTLKSPLSRWAVSQFLAVPVGKLRRKRGLAVAFSPEAAPDDFLVRGGGALAGRPGVFRMACSEIAAVEAELGSIAEGYGKLDLPVAILFGRGDRVLKASVHGTEAAKAIRGARLEVIDGGHMLPVTRPDFVAQWIDEAAKRSGLLEA